MILTGEIHKETGKFIPNPKFTKGLKEFAMSNKGRTVQMELYPIDSDFEYKNTIDYYHGEILPKIQGAMEDDFKERLDYDKIDSILINKFAKAKITNLRNEEYTITVSFYIMNEDQRLKFISSVILWASTRYRLSFNKINNE